MEPGVTQEFVLVFTHSNDVKFAREKYFTGRVLERFPEYVSDPEKAYRFPSKQAANEMRSGFAQRGFRGVVRMLVGG